MTSFYDKAAGGLPEGHSSYFESPHDHLDPSLFDGVHLHPDVRQKLIIELEAALNSSLNLRGVEHWLFAWLAGSGITYQWEGGEGDLDVLFGVDMIQFVQQNPNFAGIPEDAVATWADGVMREKVWPKTAHTTFHQRTYEVTFFWHPGMADDIESIKPYAAYDLKRDVWVVDPPLLPHDPHALYPAEWYRAAAGDVEAAGHIIRRHHNARQQLASTTAESPSGRNATAELIRARQSAVALFDDIHKGRRAAFAEQGHGYSDWHNFRWQHAKDTGVVPALRAIEHEAKAANEAEEMRLYGGPIEAADVLVTREMMRYGPRP